MHTRGFAIVLLQSIVFLAPAATRLRFEEGARSHQVRLSAGSNHTCAALDDGSVRCWGTNADGQLGDGTITTTPKTAVKVSGLAYVVSVAAGARHTCALRADGFVWCWGADGAGQLGNGSLTPSSTPVNVTGLSGVVALVAGDFFNCALQSNGTVWCWGSNSDGQLGIGRIGAYSSTPVQVQGLSGSAAILIAAGQSHACAAILNSSGNSAVCWGRNSAGQLGNSSLNTSPLPVPVSGLTGVIDIAGGGSHSCAALVDSRVACWGADSSGQLGIGFTFADSSTPSFVIGDATLSQSLKGAVGVTAGQNHSCAILASGAVRCWGANGSGQLGDGTNAMRNLASLPVLGLNPALEVSSGANHVCAIEVQGGLARCWGDNTFGQLGNGTTSPSFVPVSMAGVSGSIGARGIGTGGLFSCAHRGTATVACWGADGYGQLGNGAFSFSIPNPAAVSNLSDAITVSLGAEEACSLQSTGLVSCWGFGFGQNFTDSSVPVPENGAGNAIGVATADHTCVVQAGGTAVCWGINSTGQAGQGTFSFRAPPGPVIDSSGNPLSSVVMISTGVEHTCAVIVDGTVDCWGSNAGGALGDGFMEALSPVAKKVPGLFNIVAVSAGFQFTCALSATGGVYCWGANTSGQLGNSNNQNRTVPDIVTGLVDAVAISAQKGDNSHACAVRASGEVACWGSNQSDQLGAADTADHDAPAAVIQSFVTVQGVSIPIPLQRVIAIGTGFGGTCALAGNGQPLCWGDNQEGQIGDVSAVLQPRPTIVNSFTANVDAGVSLKSNGRIAIVTALMNCPAGGEAHLSLTLEQGEISGSGDAVAACAGGMIEIPVTVAAHGPAGFQPGTGTANVEALVKVQGDITEDQHWTRAVVLTPEP